MRAKGHSVTITGACRGYSKPPRHPSRHVGATLQGPAIRSIDRARGHCCTADHIGFSRIAGIRRGARVLGQGSGFDASSASRVASQETRNRPNPRNDYQIEASDRACARPVRDQADSAARRHRPLSDREEVGELLEVETKIAAQPLPNGVTPFFPFATPKDDVVEVLYLGRLHERKRSALFVEIARDMLNEGIDARFTLIGPDGVRRKGSRCDWPRRWLSKVDRVGRRAAAGRDVRQSGAGFDLCASIRWTSRFPCPCWRRWQCR